MGASDIRMESEKGREIFDDCSGGNNHPSGQFEDFDTQASRDRRLSKKDLSRGLTIHTHCRYWPWGCEADGEQLCVRVHWLCPRVDFERLRASLPGRGFHLGSDGNLILYDDEGAVFVDVVKFSQQPERVSLGADW